MVVSSFANSYSSAHFVTPKASPSVGSHLQPHSHATPRPDRLGIITRRIGSQHLLDRTIQTRAQWLENSAQVEVDTPVEVAWSMWEDREKIPTWMPWITSVEIQENDKHMSKWTLSTYQFNRQWEFSWLARNMTPLQYQKIHWRSVPGSTSGSLGAVEIQNQGQIRFLRKGEDRCAVKLTISYQVPSVLAPFANLLTPVVEGILQQDMERFAQIAQSTHKQQ